MRVLRVINSMHIGGAERSIASNIPLHIKNGIEMDVLLLNGDPTFYLDQLLDANVRVSSLTVGGNIYNPLLALKILPYLPKYDIVHAHLFPTLYWVAFAKMISRSRVKLVFTEHSTINRRRGSRVFKLFDQLAYNQYAKLIAISDATKENLETHFNLGAKTVVIPNGVDIDQLYASTSEFPQELSEKIKDKIVLLQVASFRKAKDQETTIRALAQLPENYELILVGEGERMPLCQALAKELSLTNRVHFVGVQKDVAPFLRAASIVIMSSIWEGFGRAAVEGMAMRKPVIATNVAGLSEVVGGAGSLVESKDDQGMAREVMRIMSERSIYETIAERCFKRAQEYSVHFMVSRYEEVYKELLSKV